MGRFGLSGFWILLGIALLDIIVVVVPLIALATIFCLFFYPAGIGYAGKWLDKLYVEMRSGTAE
ncbi:MAG: hypothetical protein Kow0099_16170 [Candidatus Abyssubacteria bacterium]